MHDDDLPVGEPVGEPFGQPVVVPYLEISPDALRGLIESFVLREGTDYGERDVAFDVKLAQVMHQLERGEARILFDPASESIDIVR